MKVAIKYLKKCSRFPRGKILLGVLIALELVILIILKICQVSTIAFLILIHFFTIIIFPFAWSSTIVLTLVCFYRIAVSLIFMIVWPLAEGEELGIPNYMSIGMQGGWNGLIIVTQECYISCIHLKPIIIRWIRNGFSSVQKHYV